MKNFSRLLLLLSMVIFVLPVKGQENEEIVAKTIEYLKEVQERWEMPGVGFAIVKDGETIFSDGFGVKEKGKEELVESSTLFQIGSVSKSFTAAVMAMLVDEGLVKWEDTVKNILPHFQMYDKWVEQNLQVKDIMTHSTGLQGQLGTYIANMGYGRDDIFNMLPLLKPKYSMRGAYEYNNITFIIASQIIEKLTGVSWEDNVRERIFKPLGMDDSRVLGEEFAQATDVATPHDFEYIKGRTLSDTTWVDSIAVDALHGDEQALHWLSVIGPAGSISSTADDMSKYLLFHLNKGEVDGNQLISKSQMEFLHKGITITSQDSARVTLYGHCWFIEQNSRYRVVFHTGTTWGFTTLCAFVPELNLGVIMMVNSAAPAQSRYAVMRRLIDLYKGFPDTDYNTQYFDTWQTNSRKSAVERDKKRAEAELLPAPNITLLPGVYKKDKLFGDAVVEIEDGELWITVGPQGWKSKLEHKNGNQYTFRRDGYSFGLTFTLEEVSQGRKKVEKCTALDISFGYTENFGLWNKSE